MGVKYGASIKVTDDDTEGYVPVEVRNNGELTLGTITFREDDLSEASAFLKGETLINPHPGGVRLYERFYFLSGPMSVNKEKNIEKFTECAKELRESGYNILNPAEDADIAYASSWLAGMRAALKHILHPNCAGIIQIDGWEDSEGASLEFRIATSLGLLTTKYKDAL